MTEDQLTKQEEEMEQLEDLEKDALIALLKQERRKNASSLKKRARLGLSFETPNNQKALGKENWDEDISHVVRKNIPYLVKRDDKTVDTDNSENAVTHTLIKGDNFPALLTLLPEYRNSIDVIYLDPPYNTGSKDFIYNDQYVDKENKYRHSRWLRFMARRLLLAREMMSEGGLVMISIDDNEQAHLRMLMDEIFGAENFISNMIWHNKKGGGNNSRFIAVENEYVLVYAKSINMLTPFALKHSEGYLKRYNQEDSRGRFYWDTFQRKSTRNYYPITCPDGTVLEYDDKGNRLSWLRNEKRFQKDLLDGTVRIVKVSNDRWSVQFKQYLNTSLKPRSIISDRGGTANGGDEAINVLGRDVFSYPKPSSLIKHLISFHTDTSATVLDFFAGSGTTGQAVAELNNEDGGRRKCILVTDAGKTGGAGNEDMSGNTEDSVDIAEDITHERMKRVITGEGWADPQKAYATGGNLEMFEVGFLLTTVASAIEDGASVDLTALEILMKLEDRFTDMGYDEETAESLAQKLYNRWRKFADDDKGDLARWD